MITLCGSCGKPETGCTCIAKQAAQVKPPPPPIPPELLALLQLVRFLLR